MTLSVTDLSTATLAKDFEEFEVLWSNLHLTLIYCDPCQILTFP